MIDTIHHPDLAAGRWHTFTLAFQLGNIGSEVSRARKAQGIDEERFTGAVERAYELLDLTISDPRWKHRLKELVRGRELFSDAVAGGTDYGTTLEYLDNYFLYFALIARAER